MHLIILLIFLLLHTITFLCQFSLESLLKRKKSITKNLFFDKTFRLKNRNKHDDYSFSIFFMFYVLKIFLKFSILTLGV